MKQELIVQIKYFYHIFLRHVFQLIKQAKEKEISVKCIKITKILEAVIIKKEMDEKFDLYEKQLKSE